jgi:uncharacterized protein YdbL (DUF1318 family)
VSPRRITRRRMLLALAAACAIPGIFSVAPAKAQSLGDLKAQALVGERPDGYLGVVAPAAPANVAAAVQKLNADRRAVYEQIAQKQNLPLAQVEAVAGAKLVREAPAGAYVMDASGRWLRK